MGEETEIDLAGKDKTTEREEDEDTERDEGDEEEKKNERLELDYDHQSDDDDKGDYDHYNDEWEKEHGKGHYSFFEGFQIVGSWLWNRFLDPSINYIWDKHWKREIETYERDFGFVTQSWPVMYVREKTSDLISRVDEGIYATPGYMFNLFYDTVVYSEKVLGASLYFLTIPPLMLHASTWFTYRFVQNFVFDIDTAVYNYFYTDDPVEGREAGGEEKPKAPQETKRDKGKKGGKKKPSSAPSKGEGEKKNRRGDRPSTLSFIETALPTFAVVSLFLLAGRLLKIKKDTNIIYLEYPL